MNASTTEFVGNLSGFVRCRDEVEETARQCLPNAYMSQVPSFRHDAHMRQRAIGGGAPASFDEISELATAARPSFVTILRTIAEGAELDPDAVAKHESRPLMIDAATSFKQLTIAPIKGRARCEEKVANE